MSTHKSLISHILYTGCSDATAFLLRQINTDGSFVYEIHANTAKRSKSYNMLRHAGTIYALLQWHTINPTSGLIEKVSTSVDFLLNTIQRHENSQERSCVVEEGEMKLGGAGLAILALFEYYQHNPSPFILQTMQRLAGFIVWMQKPSGQFHSKWTLQKAAYADFVSVYYPGEAMLGLVRLNRLDGNSIWLHAADLGMRYLSTQYNAFSKTERIHDHWLAMALIEMQQAIPQRQFYREYWLIALSTMKEVKKRTEVDKEDGNQHSYSSAQMATRGEALVSGLLMDLAKEDASLKEKATLFSWEAAAFCLKHQVLRQSHPSFNAQGGITKTRKDDSIRIDYVQHTLSLMYGLLKAEETQRYIIDKYAPKRVENFNLSVLLVVRSGEIERFKDSLSQMHKGITGNGVEIIICINSMDEKTVMPIIQDYPYVNCIIANKSITALATHLTKERLVICTPAALSTESVSEWTACLEAFPDRLLDFSDKSVMLLTIKHLDKKQLVSALLNGRPTFANWCDVKGLQHWQFSKELSEDRLFSAIESIVMSTLDSGVPYYHWNTYKPAAKHLLIKQFDEIHFTSETISGKKHRLIILVQVRNEASAIHEFIEHITPYCDGIILLDDGSADNTYDLAQGAKLLAKAKWHQNESFDDLANRNALLAIAGMFSTDWLMFMDVDERFGSAPEKLFSLLPLLNYDSMSFSMVHLWNSPREYRTDLPEGKKGIFRRFRMFRNHGYMQLPVKRALHFKVVPFKGVSFPSDLLLVHAGLQDKTTRQLKFERYTKIDAGGKMQGYSYEYLLDDVVSTAPIDVLLKQ